MPILDFKFKIDEKKIAALIGFPATLNEKVLPDALRAASVPIQLALAASVADSDDTGSRLKQSAKAKARWPYKFKEQVRTRIRQDEGGTLAITGMRTPQGQYARIDYANKARSTGRKHILWGKRPAKIPYRVQREDVARKVMFEQAEQVQAIIRTHIANAIVSGRVFRS